MPKTYDTKQATCSKCGKSITQYDPDDGLWVGDEAGSYDCNAGTLHVPVIEVEPDGKRRYDDSGQPIVDLATCGHCHRTWDDAIITSRTPAPSGRCPFEYDHEYDHEV